jgi:Zn-dependent alcohol dehydrogenase
MVTTKALVTYDVDPDAANFKPSFKMEELEIVDMADDELLVQMVATGLCHSDVTIASRPSADGIPKILGHEGMVFADRSCRKHE